VRDRVGNTLRQAQSLQNRVTVQESIGGGDRSDFYRLTFTQPSRLTLTLKRSSAPVMVEVLQDLNSNGRVEPAEVMGRSHSTRNTHSLYLPKVPAGIFFLRVSPKANRATSYRLTAISQPLLAATSVDVTPPAIAQSFVEQVVHLTNAFRQQFGLQPLTSNLKLNTAAQTHSRNMAVQDFFDHVGSDRSQPWDRMTAAGYQWSHSAENIAAGQQTAEAVVNAWITSPGHRDNMLNANLREIGVGYYELVPDTGQVNYGRYWTQVFGTAG
jgi:uncharacterized protein YkwD